MITKTIRTTVAAAAFCASAIATTGAHAAPGDYCQYVDAAVYCGVEENLYPGASGYNDCERRWERASWDC